MFYLVVAALAGLWIYAWWRSSQQSQFFCHECKDKGKHRVTSRTETYYIVCSCRAKRVWWMAE